ncbi:cleavage and polyadenylation specificity factor subunit 6-like [Thrips palmi]|uniref:Cleavage and polyadenylation specificity factor subunit 6-like n=1 Tax=Thrips palmi TaxID=161013 RepID=A0A6P8YAB8_THRPL|nr:cleavage and polyadenylation specificity factor subunit 6-like [Thrips palmi]
MKACVILLAVVAVCAAMPRPGPPAPPGPPMAPPMTPPMTPPVGTPSEKGDLKGEEALYLASPYSAYSLPYSMYNYNALPSLGYQPSFQYGNLGYQYGYPYYY